MGLGPRADTHLGDFRPATETPMPESGRSLTLFHVPATCGVQAVLFGSSPISRGHQESDMIKTKNTDAIILAMGKDADRGRSGQCWNNR